MHKVDCRLNDALAPAKWTIQRKAEVNLRLLKQRDRGAMTDPRRQGILCAMLVREPKKLSTRPA